MLESTRAGQATRLTAATIPLATSDGRHELRVFETDWSPLRDESGAVAGALQVLVETTDRQGAQTALRGGQERSLHELEQQVRARTTELQASRDLLKATMDASIDMIQVFEAIRNESGEIVDFRWVLNNHTSEHLYGDVSGQSLLQRNPGVVEEGIFDAFRRVTETGEPEHAERHYVHEQFKGWFYQSVVKLGDGVATTTKDITAWKQAQEELLRLRDKAAAVALSESPAAA